MLLTQDFLKKILYNKIFSKSTEFTEFGKFTELQLF